MRKRPLDLSARLEHVAIACVLSFAATTGPARSTT